MPWVPPGRFQSEAGSAEDTDPNEGQQLEADEGRLLSQLVHCDPVSCEDREPELGVDVVVALSVGAQDMRRSVAGRPLLTGPRLASRP